jgi:predicted transcriptional regulator
MDKEDEFLALYNQIDSLLQQRYGDYDRNKSMIMRYCQELQHSSYSEIYDRGRLLNLIRELRNSLIHDFDMNKDGLIVISDKTINFLKSEVNNLSHPVDTYSISTKVTSEMFPNEDAHINIILKNMAAKGYMQMPIINDDGSLQGVFSPNALLRYFADNRHPLDPDTSIRELRDYIPINKHISEHYEFVSRTEPAQNVSKIFDQYARNGKKLVMVFITEHGKENEKIIGIITPYDIVSYNTKH